MEENFPLAGFAVLCIWYYALANGVFYLYKNARQAHPDERLQHYGLAFAAWFFGNHFGRVIGEACGAGVEYSFPLAAGALIFMVVLCEQRKDEFGWHRPRNDDKNNGD